MKQTKVFMLGFLMAAAALGAGRECVTIQLDGAIEIPPATLATAELTAGAIYRDIAVSVNWSESVSRRVLAPCVVIGVVFRSHSPETFHPHSLAYALPFRKSGFEIYVFADRVPRGSANNGGKILGHVLAHEIGHVLEAINRHSAEGVMKAAWNSRDYSRMTMRPLRFAPEDADLIHAGLLKRSQTTPQLALSVPAR